MTIPAIDTVDTEKLKTIETIRSLAAEADEFEGNLNPHAARIAVIADKIARAFNLGSRDHFSVPVAALAHALGERVVARQYILRSVALSGCQRIDPGPPPL